MHRDIFLLAHSSRSAFFGGSRNLRAPCYADTHIKISSPDAAPVRVTTLI